MHFKKRGTRAALYRSSWVPRGTEGNSHGYTRQQFVASIALEAQELPEGLRQLLSPVEAVWVDATLCAAARNKAQEEAAQAEARERDAVWRLVDAARLVREAAERSTARAIPQRLVDDVRKGLESVCLFESRPSAPAPSPAAANPLAGVVKAVRMAMQVVASPGFPRAPVAGARSSPIYQSWLELTRLLEGNEQDSLLRSLQTAGYVKKKNSG